MDQHHPETSVDQNATKPDITKPDSDATTQGTDATPSNPEMLDEDIEVIPSTGITLPEDEA